VLTALLRRFEGVFPQNYQTGLGIRKSFHLKLYEFRAELSMAEKFKLGADLYDDGISWMKQIIKAAMRLEFRPQLSPKQPLSGGQTETNTLRVSGL